MKPNIKWIKYKTVAAALLLISIEVSATPSGLKTTPSDLIIPQSLLGKVEVIPSQISNHEFYVKPLIGRTIDAALVKSPIASCEQVKSDLKVGESAARVRTELARIYEEALKRYEGVRSQFEPIDSRYLELNSQLTAYQKVVDEAQKEVDQSLLEIRRLNGEIDSNRKLLAIESDATKQVDLREILKKQEDELAIVKRDMKTAILQKAEQSKLYNNLSLEVASLSGKRDALRSVLTGLTSELTRMMTDMRALEADSDAALAKYSQRPGALATLTMEFAPGEYLTELTLANRNRGYQFRYLSAVTATVDVSIPGNLRPGSPLGYETGTMIRQAKWSDPAYARKDHPFTKLMEGTTPEQLDPVSVVQGGMATLEASLTGSKFLSLDLSILGFCALKEPTSLESEFKGGVKDTFKLALYFTYPMYYDIQVDGFYRTLQIQHEFFKETKKSSWFGLSKKHRKEYLKELTEDKFMEVKIHPRGVTLSPEDTFILAEKVKDQLVFMSVQNHLDMKKLDPDMAVSPSTAPAGTTVIGKALMKVPNPWAFWGGLVLSSLESMFGSGTGTITMDQVAKSKNRLHYDLGFTFLVPADLTVGDLSQAKVK